MAKSGKQLDVYRDWLGITDPTRPLDYYSLLRLKRFVDDREKIRAAYRQLNAHVRKYGSGEFGPQSQELLNELARAMLCLTDDERKGEYDAMLGRPAKAGPRRRTLEQVLLANKAITLEQLNKLRHYANAVNLPMRDAVLQQRVAPAETVMQAYAESIGLPYIDLMDIPIDEELIPLVPAPTARQHLFVPLLVDDGMLLIASPNPVNPDVEDDLRLRVGYPARTVLCTPAAINVLVSKYYSREAAAARGGTARRGKKPAPARPAAGAAPQAPDAAAAAPPDEPPIDEEAEQERREQRKQKLVVAAIILMIGFILLMAYLMITA